MINFDVNVEQKRPKPVKQSSIIPVYSSLPPFAKDEKGKIINDTNSYKRVKIGEKNLQEIIDSNIEQTNYYRLIDAFNASGDINILNIKPNNNYGDVSKIPLDNVNDVNDYINGIKVEHVEPKATTEEPKATTEEPKAITEELNNKISEVKTNE